MTENSNRASANSSKPWPPPPDLDSIQELVATADVEGFIAEGAPADEYESEAELLFAAMANYSTAELNAPNLLPVLAGIWQTSFSLNDASLAERTPGLQSLADQIARFFGPEARPQVRGS
ncbi:MAG TPA: hypothetical protein VGN16_13030 [Acidobacteriaceae bacterium]|jgi:hypothetical protein